MDEKHHALLKAISDKMTWALVFLFIIMLNTCSLGDDLSDAARDLGKAAATGKG
jgi:hypothetical protein